MLGNTYSSVRLKEFEWKHCLLWLGLYPTDDILVPIIPLETDPDYKDKN